MKQLFRSRLRKKWTGNEAWNRFPPFCRQLVAFCNKQSSDAQAQFQCGRKFCQQLAFSKYGYFCRRNETGFLLMIQLKKSTNIRNISSFIYDDFDSAKQIRTWAIFGRWSTGENRFFLSRRCFSITGRRLFIPWATRKIRTKLDFLKSGRSDWWRNKRCRWIFSNSENVNGVNRLPGLFEVRNLLSKTVFIDRRWIF